MAGIKGMRSSVPSRKPNATGLFTQRATPAKSDPGAASYATTVKSRVGPKAGRGGGGTPNQSHYQNMGLKRGTAK